MMCIFYFFIDSVIFLRKIDVDALLWENLKCAGLIKRPWASSAL